jgi:hypothetical protein
MDQPTLIFATIARPQCASRLIQSVRAFFPTMPVVMVEQIDGESELDALCGAFGITRIAVPFDIGVSACRNIALRAVSTELVILADDDFVLTEHTSFDTAGRFLERNTEVAFVGGTLDSTDSTDFKTAFLRARNFAIDETGDGLILIPATAFDHNRVEADGETFVLCDMVAQWGIGRADLIREVGWDERMKTGGEHMDFFLRLKSLPARPKVAFSTCIRAAHEPETTALYESLRGRKDWLDVYREKWGFAYILPAGGSFRPLSDYDHSVPLWPDDAAATMIERQSARISQLQEALARQTEIIARKNEAIRQLREQRQR